MSEKSNENLKRAEDLLKQSNKLKTDFENNFNELKNFNDKLREYYPDLSPSPSIEDAEPYIKINKQISKITKIIENYKNVNKLAEYSVNSN